MQRTEKEQVVTELAERLRSSESLIVADYRGLTNTQLEELRGKLHASGARFRIVKNTLTRRAAEEAGAESLLALLEGPTAIAFVETDGDPVGVAKALADTARDTKVLALRGGLLSGRSIGSAEIEELAKLPAPDVVKSQLVGVIVAPLTQLVGLLAAPLRDLVGLLDARIDQLGGASADAEAPGEAPSGSAEGEASSEETLDGASADAEAPGDAPSGSAEGEASSEEARDERAETSEDERALTTTDAEATDDSTN